MNCDVLIVGGGPAGSSCAWGLRGSGLDVLVLDKQTFPRDKVCGGWITPAVVKALEIDINDYAQGRVLQPITGFRVGRIGGPALETGYGASVSYGIRRCEFDNYLLRRSGARLELGTPLTSLKKSSGGWLANNEIQATTVVGAGGHFCPVARLTGAKPRSESAVVAQEIEFEMDERQAPACQVRAEIPELYFCSDMKGYGWCFRKGNFLNIGLGRADSHKLPEHVESFVQFLRDTERVSFELPAMHGHAYLLQGVSRRTVVSEDLLLAGDSAGLAYPQSGEGILPAVQSGLLAAKTIITRNCLRESLETYRRQIAPNEVSWLLGVARSLPSSWIGFFARHLLQTRWFVRKVVLDEWFLHASSS